MTKAIIIFTLFCITPLIWVTVKNLRQLNKDKYYIGILDEMIEKLGRGESLTDEDIDQLNSML